MGIPRAVHAVVHTLKTQHIWYSYIVQRVAQVSELQQHSVPCSVSSKRPVPELQCINSDVWLVGAAGSSSAKPNPTARMASKAMGIAGKEPNTAKRIPPDNKASQATA